MIGRRPADVSTCHIHRASRNSIITCAAFDIRNCRARDVWSLHLYDELRIVCAIHYLDMLLRMIPKVFAKVLHELGAGIGVGSRKGDIHLYRRGCGLIRHLLPGQRWGRQQHHNGNGRDPHADERPNEPCHRCRRCSLLHASQIVGGMLQLSLIGCSGEVSCGRGRSTMMSAGPFGAPRQIEFDRNVLAQTHNLQERNDLVSRHGIEP